METIRGMRETINKQSKYLEENLKLNRLIINQGETILKVGNLNRSYIEKMLSICNSMKEMSDEDIIKYKFEIQDLKKEMEEHLNIINKNSSIVESCIVEITRLSEITILKH